MQYDKYFSKTKGELLNEFTSILTELNNSVNSYYKGNKPILDGKIFDYSEFVSEKHIPLTGHDLSNTLKDFSRYFQRSVLWEHPGTLINITPPANIVSIATSAYASLFNPNFAQDESSGYLMTTELLVSKYLSELVGWNYKKSGGIFTFGGKGTNLYAIKVGLKKAIPNVIECGISNNKIVVFSSEKGHPCHKEVCNWLGLGKNSCHSILTDKNGQIRLDLLEKEMRYAIENNIIIGCIIVNGGTTNEIIVDPIKKVVDLRNKLVKEYKLNYCPHIHVDAVIGWAWLFYKEYDFVKNELAMSRIEMKKIKSLKNKIQQVKYADSFGADFHKTGFCPYLSSIFMAKKFDDITMLGDQKNKGTSKLKFGEYSPFTYTLELTRACSGPVSAYIALEIFGIRGFQKLIYNVFSNSEYIRQKLKKTEGFDVLNSETEGIATLFALKDKNGNSIKDTSNLSDDEILNVREYNYQFYLFCLKLLEEGKINFKLTFSKSYKPHSSNIATGTLKLYPTSPVVSKKEIDEVINQMIDTKKIFEKQKQSMKDTRDVAIDFVYR